MANLLVRRLAPLFVALGVAFSPPCYGQAVPIAEGGGLKMVYDNRMYPQAVERDGLITFVWRGKTGLPYIRTYDPVGGKLSAPVMILSGRTEGLKLKKFRKDHHYAPVLWADRGGYWHVLFGCHVSEGIHLVSRKPGKIDEWRSGSSIGPSMSYPKVHHLPDGRTLIYFRNGGHLGFWTYRISADDGKTWSGPEACPVDLNAEPQDGFLASHAGSYHTTRVSADGKTLHVAFIWKVEDPVLNTRYKLQLGDHTQRYNLYYLKLHLPTGKITAADGAELKAPVRKKQADGSCLVWDTRERVAAVGPSIHLDGDDTPSFLLPVSEETPHRCRFYFVRRRNGEWKRTPLTGTSHPFNACHLERADDGSFLATLVTGTGEAVSEEEMDRYGWGQRVERWASDGEGENWKLRTDLTPMEGFRYQNVTFVARGERERAAGMILFYGWKGGQKGQGEGTAYLWHGARQKR